MMMRVKKEEEEETKSPFYPFQKSTSQIVSMAQNTVEAELDEFLSRMKPEVKRPKISQRDQMFIERLKITTKRLTEKYIEVNELKKQLEEKDKQEAKRQEESAKERMQLHLERDKLHLERLELINLVQKGSPVGQ